MVDEIGWLSLVAPLPPGTGSRVPAPTVREYAVLVPDRGIIEYWATMRVASYAAWANGSKAVGVVAVRYAPHASQRLALVYQALVEAQAA